MAFFFNGAFKLINYLIVAVYHLVQRDEAVVLFISISVRCNYVNKVLHLSGMNLQLVYSLQFCLSRLELITTLRGSNRVP